MTPAEAAQNLPRITFDFNQAVTRARRDFPSQTKNIFFAHAGDAATVDRAVKNYIQSWPLHVRLLRGLGNYGRSVKEKIMKSSQSMAHVDPIGNSAIVFFKPAKPLLPMDQAVYDNYTFHHELAHALRLGQRSVSELAQTVKKVTPEEINAAMFYNVPEKEHAADVFSVLYGLNNGLMTLADARVLSNIRALAAWNYADTPHFTSPSLDALVADIEENGNVTRTAVTAAAEEYAARFALPMPVMDGMRAGMKPYSDNFGALMTAAATADAPEKVTPEAYLGMKLLHGALTDAFHGAIVMEETMKESIADMLENVAARTGLEKVFKPPAR